MDVLPPAPSPPASPSRLAMASPQRLRRSLRLSGASSLSSPVRDVNKENVGFASTIQPSSSAKTPAIGLADDAKHSSSPLSGSPLASSFPQHSSPVRARSSPTRHRSPLRRHLVGQSDDFVSSSDESDDSAVVFFGKPSSAEKKKRIHYEQRVLEKRLKHKDSLVLTRRRPISFNPDDTMLVDDHLDYGWSAARPTPTPSRSILLKFDSLAESPASPVSPTRSRRIGSLSSKSPSASPSRTPDTQQPACAPDEDTLTTEIQARTTPAERQDAPSVSKSPQRAPKNDVKADEGHKPRPSDSPCEDGRQVNPFMEAQTSPAKNSTSRSPAKQLNQSPDRNQSPIRSVETLIGATVSQNREALSPQRSPRRSPRLSLRALQLSTSPTKLGSQQLAFASPSPFQHALPPMHATPFQQVASAQLVPPSTGLSRFACLQNISSISQPAETPANRVLSMRLAHHAVLPSPFISSGAFAPLVASPAKPMQTPRTPSRAEPTLSLPSPSKMAMHSEQRGPASPSKAAPAPATPSVRFADLESRTTPSATTRRQDDNVTLAARSPSAKTTHASPDRTGSPHASRAPPQSLPSPVRQESEAANASLLTPARESVSESDANNASPGPVFRQTARRVPIHQHEADFGVKVSPERSPRKAYTNSSARSVDFGPKPERIPARRVQVHASAAARTNILKPSEKAGQEASRAPSVASKAARSVSVGSNRFGSQNTSLPPSALSGAAKLIPHRLASAPASATTATQPASRGASASQGPSVASKASRGQNSASAVFGQKLSSPDKPSRSASGLPRPRQATAGISSLPSGGPGTRLPRPASSSQSAGPGRPTSRPVPMAIARLAPSQSGLNRVNSGAPTAKPTTAAAAAEADKPIAKSATVFEDAPVARTSAALKAGATSDADSPSETGTRVNSSEDQTPSVALAAQSLPVRSSVTVASKASVFAGPTRAIARNSEQGSLRPSSPVALLAPSKAAASARPPPPVMLDPEQQRLRCLAMQEKARNRAPKANSTPATSEADESPSSEIVTDGPQSSDGADKIVPHAPPSATTGPLANERSASSPIDASATQNGPAATSQAPSAAVVDSTSTAMPVPPTTTTGRPLRSARNASRSLTPSATRVAPSRGRALSLNDIIAARKIDVPLSLTDQLRLADTVHKKHNEKTLARYKITKIQRPYERPPSPDRHDHEPEACIITDDISSHRLGKGDAAPYSTPTKRAAQSDSGSSEARKCVRWYRPLFVGKGAQYGTQKCESKPALKPIHYELDRLGNKIATGDSPKLGKGQSIIIYRNYFKGEAEPADD
ncbi:hypothetical protein PaG_05876 [Moesziomyces aphidis]|uniref:Uncharacterized protein n=1 Tax=Moesziomyces aphidis TaxID=84754 RepID=W3VGP9_MOEAP|nr:hypothetical protein PaG_05876 [Moesziomyces aphidis]